MHTGYNAGSHEALEGKASQRERLSECGPSRRTVDVSRAVPLKSVEVILSQLKQRKLEQAEKCESAN
jgi:hypothetical protein